MTDVSARRRETGAGTAGRFAAEAHTEPGVSVTTRSTPALSLEKLEWAEKLTGTYDADTASGYYDTMTEVFDAARAVAVTSPERVREAAIQAEAEALSRETGVNAGVIVTFEDATRYNAAGTSEWSQDLDAWSADGLDCSRATAEAIDTRIRGAADVAMDKHRAERRATLIDQQARVAEELAALDAIDVKDQA